MSSSWGIKGRSKMGENHRQAETMSEWKSNQAGPTLKTGENAGNADDHPGSGKEDGTEANDEGDSVYIPPQVATTTIGQSPERRYRSKFPHTSSFAWGRSHCTSSSLTIPTDDTLDQNKWIR